MTTSNNLPPLGIFVVWHPSFKNGREYADHIYSELKRNASQPLSRGMNIPVFYRYRKPLLAIPFSDFEFTFTIALIDSNFVLDREYRDLLQEVHQQKNGSRLIPVAIDTTAFNAGLEFTNQARLYEKSDKKESLITIVAHEVLRHISSSPISNIEEPPKPLKLFISHAKADGLEIALQIKAYVERELPLKTFFDANDIVINYDFSKEISRNIDDAVVIAVHSDLYSTREWCRREILLAKEKNRPIVILNCFKNGESRSFPYMANVLTVHYSNIIVWEQLMTAVLKETLRLKYLTMWIAYVANLRRPGQPVNQESISGYPPELVTVLRKKNVLHNEFIYPDPPLGQEELDILKSLEPTINYLTPTSL
jgi:hypothetical protein